MSLISRVTVLIRGIFDKRVRDLEWNKPEAVYQNAIQKKRENYTIIRESLAGMSAEKKRLSARMEDQLRKLEKTERALEVAIANEDQQGGPFLIRKRNQLRKQVQTDKLRYWRLNERVEEGVAKLQDMRHSVEKLESEKNETVAEIQMLQSTQNIDSLWNNFHSAPEDVAIKSLRERLEREREIDQLGRDTDTDRIVESTILDQEFQELCRNRHTAKRTLESNSVHQACIEAEILKAPR